MLIDAVTRLEITRGLYDCNLPDIYIFPKGKSPDNLIAKSLVNSYNDKAILADMTPARRKRILSMIKDCKVEFDKTCIDRITEYAREIVKGDNYVEF